MARHLRHEHSLILIPHRSGYSTSGEVPTKQTVIMFSGSINAFKGHPGLVDYTATDGAIFGLVRSLIVQMTGKTVSGSTVGPTFFLPVNM
jgi:NAD(P)-dependent dehydrogenase (short-subunit alcohol dehydrogenase family)